MSVFDSINEVIHLMAERFGGGVTTRKYLDTEEALFTTTTASGEIREGVSAFYHGGPADGKRYLWPCQPDEMQLSKLHPTFDEFGQPLALHRYSGTRPFGCGEIDLFYVERLPPETIPEFARNGHLLYEGKNNES